MTLKLQGYKLTRTRESNKQILSAYYRITSCNQKNAAVEVAYVEHVGPEALSGGEWVHSDARAHLLEMASELGVLPDLLLVLSCKSF